MRKWKWVLAIGALPLLGVAVLWLDSYYRAVAAIRAEDERLARDIAAYRARRNSGPPLDPAVYTPERLANLPCPRILVGNAQRIGIEEGKPGLVELSNLMWAQAMPMSSLQPELVLTIEQGIDALTVTQATLRECGYVGTYHAAKFEAEALTTLERPLTRPDAPPTKPVLQRLAGDLDRLLASRRTIADTIEAEYLIDRSEVLRVLHLKDDPTGFIARPPGWREFFSWRILIVKCLRELDEQYQAAQREAAPGRVDFRVVEYIPAPEAAPERTDTVLRTEAPSIILRELLVLARWEAARIATAAALFERDRGRAPERPEELVPHYLPALPANPLGSEPFRIENGTLKAVSGEGGPEVAWPLRRE